MAFSLIPKPDFRIFLDLILKNSLTFSELWLIMILYQIALENMTVSWLLFFVHFRILSFSKGHFPKISVCQDLKPFNRRVFRFLKSLWSIMMKNEILDTDKKFRIIFFNFNWNIFEYLKKYSMRLMMTWNWILFSHEDENQNTNKKDLYEYITGL